MCGLFGALALTWVPFHLAGGASEPLWFGLAAWRWTFLSELLLALLYFTLLFTVPESPRYLVAQTTYFASPSGAGATAEPSRRGVDDRSYRRLLGTGKATIMA